MLTGDSCFDRQTVKQIGQAIDSAMVSLLKEFFYSSVRSVSKRSTYWHELGAPARNPPEIVIDLIAPALGAEMFSIKGVEWWFRRGAPNTKKDLHVDKDERMFKEQGKILMPAVASILYLTEIGGETVILNSFVDTNGETCIPQVGLQEVRVSPKTGSFCAFNGDQIHGVEVNDCQSEDRLTLLMNWWLSRPKGIEEYKAHNSTEIVGSNESDRENSALVQTKFESVEMLPIDS